VGGMAGETASAGALAAAPTTLYRVVQNGELADIVATGTYRTASGTSVEGKYFFETAQSAARFAKKMYRIFPQEGPYTITSISLPEARRQTFVELYVAGEGRAIFVPKDALPLGPVQILDHAPLP
jgi:hypothetical protein